MSTLTIYLQRILAIIVLTMPFQLWSQSPNQDYIIRTRGDTIRRQAIVLKSPYPDKNALTVKTRKNKTRTYRPRNIKSFYHNKKFYQSLPLVDKRRPKQGFARKLIDGDLSLYITRDKNVKQLYLQRDTGEIKLIPWEGYDKFVHKEMEDPKGYLRSLPTTKMTKFYYDEYSMVDYLSRYNAYKKPELHIPTAIEFHQKFKINAYAGFMVSKLQLVDAESSNIESSGWGYLAGVNITKYYTPLYAFNFSMTLNEQSIKFKPNGRNSTFNIKIRSIQTPTYVHFEGYINNKIKWYWELGGFIKVPLEIRVVNEMGEVLGLTSDIRLAPFLGAGAIYRFKNGRDLVVSLRGDSYQQRIIDSSPLAGNFIPIEEYRYYDLALLVKFDF